MNKCKDFVKKGKYTKIKIVISIIIALIIGIIYTLKKEIFVIDRIFLVGGLVFFLLLHFILKLSIIYEFIYKYRYRIAVITLLIATIFEYSGSSIGVYSDIIQGEEKDTYFQPVIGKYRSIRSDEWVVNTPIFISQAVDKDNPYSYYNNNLRGTKTDMFSVTSPAVFDILTIARPFNIGFLLFGASRGLSIIWFGKWLALALVSFEFFMLLTEKKKILALCGAALVVFSAATQWWNATDVIMWGMLAILLIDKYLKTDKLKTKIICAIGVFISAISFVFIMYPAWQIPYIYIYFALFIFLCIKNRKIYKVKKRDVIIIALVIVAISGIGLRYIKMSSDALMATINTDYPGDRFEIGGGGIRVLFSYVYSILFPYCNVNNPCEYSGMISFYPIPMILSVIYLIRNKDRKEHMKFFIPMLLVSTVFSIFSLFETNEIFARVTFLYISTGTRLAVPLGFTQILLLIYLLSIVNKDSKMINIRVAKILAIMTSIIIFSIATKTMPPELMGLLKAYVCGLILVIFIYWIFTMQDEENRKKLIIGLISMALVTGLVVNPIQKGISVLREKPLAKEIRSIVDNDSKNNLWIAENTPFFIPNYLLASGAKVLNSTNIYPNFDLYKIVLSEEDFNNKEIKKIFNRYAHVTMEITETVNKIELLYEDSIKIYLTPEKVKELKIKYIVTTRDIDKFDIQTENFEKIYDEQGISIYKVIY